MILKVLINHNYEMLKGYLKGLYINITDPNRFRYIYNLRGNYKKLNKVRKELVLKIKSILEENEINYFIISRIKTIGSFDRKEKYKKLIKKKIIKNSSIGIKIITKDKKECYKVSDILKNSNLKINLIDDFFKKPKRINKTNSFSRNKFFFKIIYNGFPIHLIIIPKDYCDQDLKDRKKYLSFIYNKIKNI